MEPVKHMRLPRAILRRELILFLLLCGVGLVSTPLIFYSGSTIESIWGDSTYTVTAFDKYWDDLVRYHEVAKLWWKILAPYFVLQVARLLFWSVKGIVKKV